MKSERNCQCSGQCRRPAPSGEREEGFALLLVLWAMLLLGALSTLILAEARAAREASHSDVRALQMRLLADAAINRAIVGIVNPGDPLRLPLDGEPADIQLFGTSIEMRATSEAGKIDLNAAPSATLSGLFRSAGQSTEASQALATRVVEWRSELAGRQREDAIAPYREAGRRYAPRFSMFRSTGELRLVLGMTDRLQKALAPLVTVWSDQASIDRSVASNEMLELLGNSGDVLATSQMTARANGVATGSSRALATGECVTLEASIQSGDAAQRRTVIVQVAGDKRTPYRIMAWE